MDLFLFLMLPLLFDVCSSMYQWSCLYFVAVFHSWMCVLEIFFSKRHAYCYIAPLATITGCYQHGYFIVCDKNTGAKAKCLLCLESHVRITFWYSNLYDRLHYWSWSAALGVAGNTAPVQTTVCTGVGKRVAHVTFSPYVR